VYIYLPALISLREHAVHTFYALMDCMFFFLNFLQMTRQQRALRPEVVKNPAYVVAAFPRPKRNM
jgi:hypothetical protein